MRKIFNKGVKPAKEKPKVVGDVRQSQIINTFGIGSMVDFVNDTVMIAGIDSWDWNDPSSDNTYVVNNENLQNLLGVDYFVKPKIDSERKSIYSQKSMDIPAYRFPETLYCTKCHRLFNYKVFNHQEGRQFKCICGNKTLVPSRFVVICEKGHIADFPYYKWVHRGGECKEGKKSKLYLKNKDGKSGLDSLYVYCSSCGATRTMKTAFRENGMKELASCEGSSPWLKKVKQGYCQEPLMTRLRSSSDIYFPATVSALSIPPWSKRVYKELGKHYSKLGKGQERDRYVIEDYIMPSLKGLSFEDILSALDRLRNNKKFKGEKKDWEIYEDEYKVITKYHGDPDNDDEYSAEDLEAPEEYKDVINKIVAIDKLTEVNAMIGFTRKLPWSGSFEDANLQKLSEKDVLKIPVEKRREQGYWFPAVELKGEGIFIEFNLERIKQWSSKVKGYYNPLKEIIQKENIYKENFSPEYVMLHTLSHLLIRQLSLECGYSASSLKEKIYSTYKGKGTIEMAGILIYTATTDSDGSLGGLVEQAYPERIETVLKNALKEATWCASDPVCINSNGKYGQGYKSLNYGACHSCTLLPETSCEFKNSLLDRGALVGTVDNKDLGFFSEYI